MWMTWFHGKIAPMEGFFHRGFIRKGSTWSVEQHHHPELHQCWPEGRSVGVSNHVTIFGLDLLLLTLLWGCGTSDAALCPKQLSFPAPLKHDSTRRHIWLKMFSPKMTEQHQRAEAEAVPVRFSPLPGFCPFFSALLVCPRPPFTLCPFIHPSPCWALPSIHLQSD